MSYIHHSRHTQSLNFIGVLWVIKAQCVLLAPPNLRFRLVFIDFAMPAAGCQNQIFVSLGHENFVLLNPYESLAWALHGIGQSQAIAANRNENIRRVTKGNV